MVGAGEGVVGGEVVGADRGMDDDGVAVVGVFDLLSDEVGVGDELGDGGGGALVPVAEAISELVESQGAELGFESGLGGVLIGL